ncbi:DUF4367 domain-containing protein [Heyndrickxia sp. MSNUG]|uniref:DUF4367 domain-containing protein n=1 Tax=Heyndrickxia sp. MSNUG TaxID=3136677 RepID=UPI003C2C44A8
MMENQIKNLKENLSKGELADFIFTEKMRRNILEKTSSRTSRNRTGFTFSNVVPRSLSLAAVLLFSAGIYYIVSSGLQDQANPVPNSGRSPDSDIILPQPGKDTDLAKEKPTLVNPSYIPEGYVYKQTRTNENTYRHVYVKENNEDEYFTYGMQEDMPQIIGESEKEIELADGLTAQVYQITEEHQLLTWQDEGFYQTVEQFGEMSDIDFYKIVESILEAKGHTVLLDQYISELEAAQKAEEEEKARMAFDEDKAVALLEKYKTVMDEAFADSHNSNDFKFKSYNTKEDFYALFTDFVSREQVEATFSFRVKEKADGLYNLPMDGPPIFWPENPYLFVKISDTEYKLTQFQDSDMDGKQNLIFLFKYEADKWIIQDIQVIQQ